MRPSAAGRTPDSAEGSLRGANGDTAPTLLGMEATSPVSPRPPRSSIFASLPSLTPRQPQRPTQRCRARRLDTRASCLEAPAPPAPQRGHPHQPRPHGAPQASRARLQASRSCGPGLQAALSSSPHAPPCVSSLGAGRGGSSSAGKRPGRPPRRRLVALARRPPLPAPGLVHLPLR